MNRFDSVDDFNFDLRRTIILSHYIKEWGVPKSRVVARKEGGSPIEVYFFPGEKAGEVSRFATIGVSSQKKQEGISDNNELLFVLANNLGEASENEVFNYLLDISAYSLREDVSFRVGSLINESSLAPKSWKLKAILVDEALGESKVFERMHVGCQHVGLLWLVPIYGNECRQIREKGIESFDRYCEQSDFSLADLSRPSVVPIQ